MKTYTFQFWLVALAGWVNSQQQDVIAGREGIAEILGDETRPPPGPESESECRRGALCAFRKKGMPGADGLLQRGVALASDSGICRALPPPTQPSRARESAD